MKALLPVLCLLLAPLAALVLAVSASAAEPSRLDVKPLNGVPQLFLDGSPIAPIIGGLGADKEVRDGKLCLDAPAVSCVGDFAAVSFPVRFTVQAELTMDASYAGNNANGSKVMFAPARGNQAHYDVMLNQSNGKNYALLEVYKPATGWQRPIQTPLDWQFGQPVTLRLEVDGVHVKLFANDKLMGEWSDTEPLAADRLVSSAYCARGTIAKLRVRELDGTFAYDHQFTPPPIFKDAGIHLLSLWDDPSAGADMENTWLGPEKFDFSILDFHLAKLARQYPERGRLMIWTQGYVPKWWAHEHPDEMILFKTLEGNERRAPLVPAFSSRAYREAYATYLKALFQHLKKHPEGWRVVGAMVNAKNPCEWVYSYGDYREFADYSAPQRDSFRAWLRQRYGTDDTLRAAWKNDTVTLDTAEIPAPAERVKGDWYEFKDPVKSRPVVDYNTFHGVTVAEAVIQTCQTIKDLTGGRMFVWPYYGYGSSYGKEFRNTTIGSHSAVRRVIDSPALDSFISNHSFEVRGFGGTTHSSSPVASMLLANKFYLLELDDHPYNTGKPQIFGEDTAEQVAASAARCLGWAIANGAGAIVKDWGRYTYNDPPTMRVFERMRALAEWGNTQDRTPRAEIAMVTQRRAAHYLRDQSELYTAPYLQQHILACPRIGAPYDYLLLDDLERARPYKFYIFQDAWHLTPEERAMIERVVKRNGQTALWLFADGLITDAGIDLANIRDLTGISVKCLDGNGQQHLTFRSTSHPYLRGVELGSDRATLKDLSPFFYVDDPAVTVLGMASLREGGQMASGTRKPGFAVREFDSWTSVYCSVPVLPPAVIRNMAREAGAHIYADTDDAVAANDWMLCVCAASDGPRTIRLPKPATLVDALSGETTAKDASQFEVDMQYGETRVWKLER
jgi:hypothetical protein